MVERHHVSALLDGALQAGHPLALVSAPAGAGKSTALASWLAAKSVSSAWIQVDQLDQDPMRFWSAVVAALSEIEPGLAPKLKPSLRAQNVSFAEGPLVDLLNALDEIEQPVIIVLDDYHLISGTAVHDGVQSFIDGIPSHITLVISTRMDPPLRIGRLRVSGQLTELRGADLQFRASEANHFFANSGLTEDELNVLCSRTEGWAAGLVLAAASFARSRDPDSFVRDFAGDNRMVVDYVEAELWLGLGADTADRMLATSILDEMCGPLVDAVLGCEPGEGARWLESSAAENQLILPLDHRREWYRYHHLLQDWLQSELRRSQPTRIAELHILASGWHREHGDVEQAIKHALAAGATDEAAALIGQYGSTVFSEGQLVTVQGWLDALGPELVESQPWCTILQIWTLVIAGRFDMMDPRLDNAATLLASGVAGDETEMLTSSLTAATAVTAIARGDIGEALRNAEVMASASAEQDMNPLVAGIVGVCHVFAGQFEEARPHLVHSVRTAPLGGEFLIAVTSTLFLGIIAMEEGNIGAARHHALSAVNTAKQHHLTEYRQMALVHSLIARTMPDAALKTIRQHADRGVALSRRSSEPLMLAYALVSRAWVALENHAASDAEVDLTEAREILTHCPDPGIVLTFTARAEARLGGGRLQTPPRAGIPTTEMVEDLTNREITIVRLLPSRLTVREIAGELYVSQNTVKGHLKAIYRKLGVNERALAVQRARELHLL